MPIFRVGPYARMGVLAAVFLMVMAARAAAQCTYSLTPSTEIVSSAGVTGETSFLSTEPGCAWTVTANRPWITITSAESGTGATTITYDVAANTGPARSGTITAGSATLTVTQISGCSYNLQPASLNVPLIGGAETITLSTGDACSWTAVSNAPWISITGGGSGTGDGQIDLLIQPNPGLQRTGTLTIAGLTYAVTQVGGCFYELSADSATFGPEPGAGSFTVTVSNVCDWEAVSSASWLVVTFGQSGTGNGLVTYTVSGNSGPERTGTITIEGQVHTVTQTSGCVYSVVPDSRTFGAAGGASTFNLTTNASCTWELVPSDPWITITSSTTGSGSTTVGFTVAPNDSIARTGTISVAGQTVTIDQDGGCAYALSAESATVGPDPADFSIDVTTGADCPWMASSSADWLILGTGSGAGSGELLFSVEANPGPERVAAITVEGEVYTLTQTNGCGYTLDETDLLFNSLAASGSVELTTTDPACDWTATSTASWLTLTSAGSGSGGATITFDLEENTGATRAGQILVGDAVLDITQQAPCDIQLSQTQLDFGSGGGTGSVDIVAEALCPWRVATEEDWIVVTSASTGTGPDELRFRVEENNGPERTGILMVENAELTITQESNCSYTLSEPGAQFESTGGSGSVTVTTEAGCTWDAISDAPWLTITSGASGSGTGTVSYTVAQTFGSERNATITVAGEVYAVTQTGADLPELLDFGIDGFAGFSDLSDPVVFDGSGRGTAVASVVVEDRRTSATAQIGFDSLFTDNQGTMFGLGTLSVFDGEGTLLEERDFTAGGRILMRANETRTLRRVGEDEVLSLLAVSQNNRFFLRGSAPGGWRFILNGRESNTLFFENGEQTGGIDLQGFFTRANVVTDQVRGRSEVLITNWFPDTARLAHTRSTFGPQDDRLRRWGADAVFSVNEGEEVIPGGDTRINMRFADPGRQRLGIARFNARNGDWRANAIATLTTTEFEARDPDFIPEMLGIFPERVIFRNRAALTRVTFDREDALLPPITMPPPPPQPEEEPAN